MREIQSDTIVQAVRELCIRACRELPEDIVHAMEKAKAEETWPEARSILDILLENQEIARRTQVLVCQDTGMTVVFAEVGQEVHIQGDFEAAIQKGVHLGYTEGYLRKSVVRDPLDRVNTGDNTPAIVHVRLVPGDKLRLIVAPKGAGSENMSRLTMLTPAQGLEGVRRFVMETVEMAGSNPCPPMILGIGIGGNFETAPLLAKQALLAAQDAHHPDARYAALEEAWLEEINASGIGPQGLGGRTTCLGVHILAMPTHIACLPVAVNVGCHVTRHAETVL